MRAFQIIPAALSTLTLLTSFAAATPLDLEGGGDLEKRCSTYCGYYRQLCCADGESCITNSDGEAVCESGGSSGSSSWEYYTTTWVATETETQTFTSTWSSLITASATGTSCNSNYGETKCGSVCCSASESCYENQCVAESSSNLATATPPVRATSDGSSTVTQTSVPTTTEPFTAPVNTAGASTVGVKASGSGGLSGGAIAGIVIGTIAGVALLLLLCACMCCRGAVDGLAACLGCGGRRRRKETTYVEDRYSHHSHGGAARPEKRTWFGSRPSRPQGDAGGEKKSRFGSLATVGIVLGALALCLGLRRRKDQDEKSDYTYPSSYTYYSDYYTESSVSSDRRTRETRRTRDTRRSGRTGRSGRTRSSRTNSRR